MLLLFRGIYQLKTPTCSVPGPGQDRCQRQPILSEHWEYVFKFQPVGWSLFSKDAASVSFWNGNIFVVIYFIANILTSRLSFVVNIFGVMSRERRHFDTSESSALFSGVLWKEDSLWHRSLHNHFMFRWGWERKEAFVHTFEVHCLPSNLTYKSNYF